MGSSLGLERALEEETGMLAVPPPQLNTLCLLNCEIKSHCQPSQDIIFKDHTRVQSPTEHPALILKQNGNRRESQSRICRRKRTEKGTRGKRAGPKGCTRDDQNMSVHT